MIIIAGKPEFVFDDSTLSELERSIYQKKKSSTFEYRYDSVEVLLFELRVRTQIVESARLLSKSGVRFADFKHSKCNEAFWDRNDKGGFELKKGVAPHDGIKDIFNNGRLYAFECATAVVLVLYKAILESIGPKQFDVLFSDLLLYDWHYSSNLHLKERTHPEDAVAGDLLYFNNPDFDPATPWWRGENVVKLEKDLYYGHGIGIKTAEEFIAKLNSFRKPKSTQSASLSDRFDQLDFSSLWQLTSSNQGRFIIAKVGTITYVNHYQPN
ncbi:protein-glutamine gamma-glutamyltransferase [Paenibacillus sp. LMG 31456]|uniref:Protein-glutamine gamma-glutamyltransferase n=1 Tax=Paenibacillus foliorum TaxID=2654974 RepID=A0A972JYI6_9BACL|nr:protein-glutamine gamma-glutamyltransferase [Paenibacillus foliorum]NOU92586.1 protein-glutamine gamma-glutamyltransferase [Paenibacillus foliorum]